ncbi:MAG: 16S rRNA (guanine(527)-N(7))-methyltransferase RsmG [Parvibaculaceae bacterium]
MAGKTVQVVDPESFFAAAHVSRETLTRLTHYESLLRKWQKSINLVARSTLETAWQRHFWDSAQLLDAVPPDARKWVDLGSGAGFPGLVIAILLAERPGFAMHLIESDQRKAVFLREVIRVTDAPAQVHTGRIEDPGTIASIGVCDVVSARACAPLDRLLGWAAPYFGPETRGLFLKGAQVQEELTLARKSWTFSVTSRPSRADTDGTLLQVEHLDRD